MVALDHEQVTFSKLISPGANQLTSFTEVTHLRTYSNTIKGTGWQHDILLSNNLLLC